MEEKDKKDQEEVLDQETKEETEEYESVEAELIDEETGEKSEEEESLQMQLLRLQADFQNYRNRKDKERKDVIRLANESLIMKLLEVVDNFERALCSEKEKDAFYEGMEMIHQQLLGVLQAQGLEVIESDGVLFDPKFHQAVMAEDSEEVEKEHIIETLQKGYMLHGKVIRPAMVKVAN